MNAARRPDEEGAGLIVADEAGVAGEHAADFSTPADSLDEVIAQSRSAAGMYLPTTLVLFNVTLAEKLEADGRRLLSDLWAAIASDVAACMEADKFFVEQMSDTDLLVALADQQSSVAEELSDKARKRASALVAGLKNRRQKVALKVSVTSGNAAFGRIDELLKRALRDLDKATPTDVTETNRANKCESVTHCYVMLPAYLLGQVVSLIEQPELQATEWKRSGRVLIVDDDEFGLQIAANILTNNGYYVAAATTAADAERHLLEGSFDLIVMDVHLAGENGLSVVADFRRRNLCKDASIVVATVDRTRETLLDAVKTGVSGYILKPYRPGLLVDKVAESIDHERVVMELRAHRRLPADVEVMAQRLDTHFSPLDEPFATRAVDVSVSGIRLTSPKFLENTFLKLWLPLRTGQQVETPMHVLRCRSAGVRYEIGGRFVAPLTLSE